MAVDTLSIEIKTGEPEAIVRLLRQAFEEDYRPYQNVFKDPIHILGKINGRLISHALWTTRWLKLKSQPLNLKLPISIEWRPGDVW